VSLRSRLGFLNALAAKSLAAPRVPGFHGSKEAVLRAIRAREQTPWNKGEAPTPSRAHPVLTAVTTGRA
jgi:hypothetical protein